MLKTLLRQNLIVAMVILLSGCIAAAFATGAAIGGAVVYDKRAIKVMYDDQTIEYQAMRALEQNSDLVNNARISVTSFNYVLLLVGEAPSKSLRIKAQQVVAHVPKVRRIVNQITIGNPINFSTQSNDSWITTQVKTKMLATKGLTSSQIKVITENSIVYLMGIVTKSQAQLASKVASQIKGVTKVATLFEYKAPKEKHHAAK